MLFMIKINSAQDNKGLLATKFKTEISCNDNTGKCMTPEECSPPEKGEKIELDLVDER